MYTADDEHKYKTAGDLLRQEQYRASFDLAQELEESMPESPGVAMFEALNLYMMGRTDEAAAACERVRERLYAIRQNGELLNDLLNEVQRRDLHKHLDEQETKARALLESLGRGNSTLPASTFNAALRDAVMEAPAGPAKPGSRDDRLAAFSQNLEQIRKDERAGSDSSQALLQELQRLREADAANTAELERARLEVDALQRSLDEREQAIAREQQSNTAREVAMSGLLSELTRARRDADLSSETERQLSAEFQKLRSIEDEKNRNLVQAREQMNKLAEDLKAREVALSRSAVSEAERDHALQQLNSELERLREEAETSSESEKVLGAELARLKSVEQEQAAALQQARGEMDRLAFELALREKIIASAEQSEAERELQMGRLRAELDTIRREASDASASERKLAEELGRLRIAEAERVAAMERSRQETDALRRELELREKAIAAAQQTDAERAQTIDRLHAELGGLRAEAREAADSEKKLVVELDRLRDIESETKKNLDQARSEVGSLKNALRDREQVIAASEKSEAERQRTIAHLQVELDALRREAFEASKSKSDLAGQLDRLRAIESEKTSELARARTEMDTLRAAVLDREKLIAVAQTSDAERRAATERLQVELDGVRRGSEAMAASEKALAAELEGLRDLDRGKEAQLDASRREIEGLQLALVDRERTIKASEQSEAQRATTVRTLQEQLQRVQADAERAAASEKALTEELQRLREIDLRKTLEVETAKRSIQDLQRSLEARESVILGAETRNQERAQQIQSLQVKFDTLAAEARESSAEGRALRRELDQLRAAQHSGESHLVEARLDMQSLQATLDARERSVAEAETSTAAREAAMDKTRQELDALQRQAAERAASEAAVAAELERFRTASASALAKARSEMLELHERLAARERAFREAESGGAQRERAIGELQRQLEETRRQTQEKAASESALAAELARFKSASAEALEQARGEMAGLKEELARRQRLISDVEKGHGDREQAIHQLQRRLDDMEARAEQKARSEAALASELDRFKSASADALEKARTEMAQLQAELARRETAIRDVEARRGERESAISGLQEQLGEARARAEQKAASETALSVELTRIREASAQALDEARRELERLRGQLAEREELIRAAESGDSGQAQAIAKLQADLHAREQEAADKARSKDALEQELERMRTLSTEALDDARREVQDLRRQLTARARVVETEEARTSLRETAIDKLQSDLERVKSEALQKARSEQALRAELERFKSASAEAMDQARRDVEELERELEQRAASVRKSEEEARRRDAEVRHLQETLDAMQAEAARREDSEQRLTCELDRVRLDKEEELRRTRELVNQLQKELEDKGLKAQIAERASAERDELLNSLRQSVDTLERRPESAASSPDRSGPAIGGAAGAAGRPIEAGLPGLGDTAAIVKDVEGAQAEVHALRNELELRESLMRRSAEQGVRREETLLRLQEELKKLHAENAPPGDAETLLAEIRSLQSERDSGEQALRETRRQTDELRRVITDRLDGLRRIEDRAKSSAARSRRTTPKRFVILLAVSVVALGTVLYQFFRLGYFGIDPTPTATPASVTDLAPVEPVDAPRAMDAPGPRVVHFPGERTLGTLSIRSWDYPEGVWRVHGDARGPMSLGGEHVVKLTIPNAEKLDLAPLAKLGAEDLYALTLSGPGVTDAQLKNIAPLSGLRELAIEQAGITAAGLEVLRAMPGLRSLSLRDTPLPAGAVDILGGLGSLEKLDVRGTGLAKSAVGKLTAALPACTIESK
jgi:chromosome segregation ATPase